MGTKQEKSPKSPQLMGLKAKQTYGMSATPRICPPGVGGPTSFVIVAGVHM
jgi:hypothetical protein